MIKVFFAQAVVFAALFGLSTSDSGQFACTQIDTSKLTVNGLVGNIYYYPWDLYLDANENFDDVQTYISENAISNSTIVTENDGHSLSDPATVATNVIFTCGLLENTNLKKRDGLFSGLPKLDAWTPATASEIWDYDRGVVLQNGSYPFVPVTNYLLYVSGYFVPKITGDHTFSIHYYGAFAMISFGNGNFEDPCCANPESTIGYYVSGYQQEGTLMPRVADSLEIFLVAGSYYPISFIFVPRGLSNAYRLSFEDPDNNEFIDFSDYVVNTFNFDEANICNFDTSVVFEDITRTSYSYGESYETFSVTTQIDDVDTVVTEISTSTVEYIINPFLQTTTNEYVPYTGSTSYVSSIETKTVNSTVLEIITKVDVPYSTFNGTRTTFDSTISSEIFSTLTTTVTPSSGVPFVSDIVIEIIPDGHTETTIFAPNSYSTSVTYSTSFVTVPGENSIPTITTIYYVYTPYSTVALYSTSYYSDSYSASEVTFFSTETYESGPPVVQSLIVYYFPDSHSETTVESPNSYLSASTYSTDYYTVSSNGTAPSIHTVYYVYTPYSTYSTVSTKEYSGSLELTETTITSTVTPTNSQEAPYVTIITIVDSPISTASTSTTSSNTSTSSSASTSSSTSTTSSATPSSTPTSSSTTFSSTSAASNSSSSVDSNSSTSFSKVGSTSSTSSTASTFFSSVSATSSTSSNSVGSTSAITSSTVGSTSSTSEILSSTSKGAIYSNTTSNTNSQVSPTTSQGFTSSSCVASGLSNTFVGYTATYEIDINFLKAETLYVIAELEQVDAVVVPSIEFDLYNTCTGTKTPVTYIVDQSETNSTFVSEEVTLSSLSKPAKEILIATVILPVSENGELSQSINFIVPQYSNKRDTEVVSYLHYEITFSNSTSFVNGPYTLSPEMAYLSYAIGSDESESTSSSTSSGSILSSTLSVPTLSSTSSGSTLSSTSVVSTNTSDTLTMSTSITSSSVSKTTLETSEFASAQSLKQTSLSDVSATKGSNTNQYSSATPASEEHSTEILSNMQTTVVTITSCGTETCYPVEVTTVVPCSTTDLSASTAISTSGSASDTFSKIESLQTDTAIASTTIYPSKSTTIAISATATSQNVAGNKFTIVSLRALVLLVLTNLFII